MNMNKLKSLIASWLPKSLFSIVKNVFLKREIRKRRKQYRKKIMQLKGKEGIKVVFLVIHESVWKYDKLYKMLATDERFDPIIVICPYIKSDKEKMFNDLKNGYKYFKHRDMNVICTYKNNRWIDLKKVVKPDIVFFTNPYNLTHPNYLIDNFKQELTCYVPYNFGNSHMIEMFHNLRIHNILWRYYVETNFHQQLSEKVAFNNGENTIVTGYPGLDPFFIKDENVNHKVTQIWKKQNSIKIIWAPHHTIDDDKSFISFSSFLHYHNFFIEILKKYRNQIEIMFKPHPMLREKLYSHEDWGKEKTDRYYLKWTEFENSGIHEGYYEDLFKTSDAMIHDSGSFLIEYLVTEKPVLRTDRDPNVTDRMNELAKKAYKKHYIATNENEVNKFILNLIDKNDPLKNERIEFVKNYLIPPNNNTASKNILLNLKSELS